VDIIEGKAIIAKRSKFKNNRLSTEGSQRTTILRIASSLLVRSACFLVVS